VLSALVAERPWNLLMNTWLGPEGHECEPRTLLTGKCQIGVKKTPRIGIEAEGYRYTRELGSASVTEHNVITASNLRCEPSFANWTH
jgi:hypothetical protein